MDKDELIQKPGKSQPVLEVSISNFSKAKYQCHRQLLPHLTMMMKATVKSKSPLWMTKATVVTVIPIQIPTFPPRTTKCSIEEQFGISSWGLRCCRFASFAYHPAGSTEGRFAVAASNPTKTKMIKAGGMATGSLPMTSIWRKPPSTTSVLPSRNLQPRQSQPARNTNGKPYPCDHLKGEKNCKEADPKILRKFCSEILLVFCLPVFVILLALFKPQYSFSHYESLLSCR
mmetsp:Transcript_10463/g.21780  ORF Transcript_10463/g.21780 Transcript_10463/m.21780 type:complete len:230 (-) Transcript_10463:77-766(-)